MVLAELMRHARKDLGNGLHQAALTITDDPYHRRAHPLNGLAQDFGQLLMA